MYIYIHICILYIYIGARFICFTNTKVQMMTQKALFQVFATIKYARKSSTYI